MAADETLLDRGSRLCMECGLCCDGALHEAGALLPEEVPVALGWGMTVSAAGPDARFALPCHLLKNRCCSVYADRPSACGGFKCSLLGSLEAGENSFEDCLDKVRTARKLLSRLEEVLPPGVTMPQIRASFIFAAGDDGILALNTPKLDKAEIKLHAFALNDYLDRYFRNEDGKLLVSSGTETNTGVPSG